jgi:hypothetical protein
MGRRGGNRGGAKEDEEVFLKYFFNRNPFFALPSPLLYAQSHPIPHLRRGPTSISFHYALTLT